MHIRMNKKRRPVSSVDGFLGPSASNRSIGFDPYQRQPNDAFPGVGMTLSSYAPTNAVTTSTSSIGSDFGKLPPTPLPDGPPRGKPKKQRRFGWKKRLAVLLVLLLLPAGWFGFKLVHNLSKVFHGSLFSALSTTKLQGEDQGRVNILVAGNSSDDPLHQGADLTDSVMVLSIDTKNNTAFMLSVPRDLWVYIPDFGHAKINEAYVDGQQENFKESGYFPGGMGLLQKVIEENFNINLNYYGLVNYNAFRDMVNAVGGISLNIQSSDKRGLYDPSVDYVTHGPLVKLTNGVHTLNGEQALDLARARGDAYGSYGFPMSDFDRTNHQRQMILALRSKAVSTGVLANPVKISSLLDAIGNNIKTNFSLSEVHRLYDITKGIPVNSIQSIGLNSVHGKDLLTNYTSNTGEDALIPAAGVDDFTDIQAFITQITSNNPITREGATVVVLNATDTSGLASQAKQNLTSSGVTVGAIGDATTTQATSSIIDNSGGKYPATLQLLKQQYGPTVTTTNPYKYNYTADFIVLVGNDKIPKTTTTSTTSSQ